MTRGPVWQGDPAPPPEPSISVTIGGPTQAERLRTTINEALTPSRLDAAIEAYRQEAYREAVEGPKVVHHPIDPELQTGDSRGLGGAMEIQEKDPPQSP